MGDDPAARAHAARRVAKEDGRSRAAPMRVGRREVSADVAVAERAIERVGERVQADVGVGMAGEALVVGNAHPAEPDVRRPAAKAWTSKPWPTRTSAAASRSRASAALRSSMVVTFMFAGSPSKT